ncbi:hypothetical protein DEO48_19455 [Enterobacter sp. CGMCC 5087]|uniref:hypothetical protein n=1 Tax=Enterobacter sp. CGMCC 5087 TaxID=2183878 RepID=UPI000D67F5C4|nr:hypothetical protein [Enterobacter sp. CGMCC 5087]PWI78385.1 hypothetical protein DEO48_19455 [Enterobacter sp. CGMCC 5087]
MKLLLISMLISSTALAADGSDLFYCHSDNNTIITATKKGDKLVVKFGGKEFKSMETIQQIKRKYQEDYNEAIKEGADDFGMFEFTTIDSFVSIGSGLDKSDYSDAMNRVAIVDKKTGSTQTYWCSNDDVNNLDSMK